MKEWNIITDIEIEKTLIVTVHAQGYNKKAKLDCPQDEAQPAEQGDERQIVGITINAYNFLKGIELTAAQVAIIAPLLQVDVDQADLGTDG
jgi:hypothetical protein